MPRDRAPTRRRRWRPSPRPRLRTARRRRDVLFGHRRADLAGRQDALAHAAAQIARHQHHRRRVFRIVAVAVLLVAEPDLDRILVPGGADQAGLGALVLDQGVEPDRGAVDAQVAVRDDVPGADAEILGHQLEAVADGERRIGRRRKRLVEPDLARLVGQHEIGERSAGIDAETYCVRMVLLFRQPAARCLRSCACGFEVDGEAGRVGEDDAIVLAGAFDGDQAALDVPDHLLDRPLQRRRHSRRRRGSCW